MSARIYCITILMFSLRLNVIGSLSPLSLRSFPLLPFFVSFSVVRVRLHWRFSLPVLNFLFSLVYLVYLLVDYEWWLISPMLDLFLWTELHFGIWSSIFLLILCLVLDFSREILLGLDVGGCVVLKIRRGLFCVWCWYFSIKINVLNHSFYFF